MRGHRYIKKHKIDPDPKYGNTKIAKFINYVMREGKKTVAQRIVYGALDIIKEKTGKNPLEVFELAIKNVSPLVEVKGRRIGGASYQVPFPVSPSRQFTLASRWIIASARAKKGKPMEEKLADEIIMASENKGEAIKKKENVHKMAEANRAFAHFARFG